MSLGYVKRDLPSSRKDVKITCPTIIVAQPRVRSGTTRDAVWKYIVIITSTCSSVYLVVGELIQYSSKKDYILPVLILCFAILAINRWLNKVLSMNLLRLCNTERCSAIYLYVLAMAAYFASSLAVMRLDYFVQFIASFIAATIAWTAFMTVFEGRYFVPTRQQCISLVHIWVATAMWELRTYLINAHIV